MKQLLFFFLAISSFTFIACDGHNHGDEDGPYEVTITINKPSINQVAAINTPLDVDVELRRDDEKTIHNVFIEVRNTDGASVVILDEGHKHVEGTYTYQAADWIPMEAGSYILFVETRNDAGEEANEMEVPFVVE